MQKITIDATPKIQLLIIYHYKNNDFRSVIDVSIISYFQHIYDKSGYIKNTLV